MTILEPVGVGARVSCKDAGGEKIMGTIVAASVAEPWAPYCVAWDRGGIQWTDLRGDAWELEAGRVDIPRVKW